MMLQCLKCFLCPITPFCSASKLTARALKQRERGIHTSSVHFCGAAVIEVRFTSAYTPSARPPTLAAATNDNAQFRGKPFLTASNPPNDHGELSTRETVRERIEGVSRSLPYSDLLTLTSSHMFISVMT